MTRRDTATGPSPGGDDPIRVVLVSGFLGAGKTTALRTAAGTLSEQGYTVGMITNDQASGLVDTSVLEGTAGAVVEIPGGCFCCNFEDLVAAANEIRRRDVDLLLAEPVGSCTDLVATVINPLESMYAEAFSVAPLTVFLDPRRVRSYLDGDGPDLPEEVWYIFRRQVEEADLVALNKADTLAAEAVDRLVDELGERVGDRPVFPVSARTGEGIGPWLSLLVDGVDAGDELDVTEPIAAGSRALADIDYDTYADGEAKLGWVNVTVDLEGPADGALCRANLTATDAEPGYAGADPGMVEEGRLVFNARAVGDPGTIRAVAGDAVEAAAARTGADATVADAQAFRPEYPEPVHRMADDPDPADAGSPGSG